MNRARSKIRPEMGQEQKRNWNQEGGYMVYTRKTDTNAEECTPMFDRLCKNVDKVQHTVRTSRQV